MIYGRGCKGNFRLLAQLANRLPVFPKVANQRSMLYIGNLVEFIRLMMDHREAGTFWPQNAEYSNTSELVRMIATAKGRRLWLVPGLGWLLKIAGHCSGLIDKAFGNLCYDQRLSDYKEAYRCFTLAQSLERTLSNDD